MISWFSFYKPLFMAQLLLAEFLCTCRLPRRSGFWLRYAVTVAVCLLFSVLIPGEPDGPVGLSLIFLLLFAFTFALNCFCFDVSVLSLLFCLSVAYVVQHFAYCLSNCMLLLTGLNTNVYGVYTEEVIMHTLPVNAVFGYIFSFVIYYFSYYLFYLFFARRIRKREEPRIRNIPLFFLSIIAILFSIFINAVVVYGTDNGDLIIAVNFYNAACCLFIVYVLFGILNKTRMEKELSFVYGMLSKAEEQYEASKKNIEMINIKCHDLKQQIRTIGRANYINDTAIAEMSEAISIYDSAIKTGNVPLDIILTEKSLYCYKNSVVLSCMADGQLLGFMNEAEIYGMFGNALDNAISAVLALDDPEKRCVGLSVARVKGFVAVNVHNYYAGEIKRSEDGLPLTTKKEGEHGLGLKSIRYIAEKYGGKMSVQAEEGIFNLNILFPISEN